MTTQFISKADRIGRTFVRPDSDPGPGTYDAPSSIRKSLPGFVPFTTSSNRSNIVNTAAISTPAPGSYDTAQAAVKKSAVSSNAFKSKSDRFNQKAAADTPAPSKYRLKSVFDLPKRSHSPTKSTSVNILEIIKSSVSQPAVPSIPIKNQSYGYEVDLTGKLQPQIPVHAGFSGLKTDTVGPLDYNPNINIKFTKAPQIAFGKDTKTMMGELLRLASNNPGPGYYNTISSFDMLDDEKMSKDADFLFRFHSSKRHETSSFVTKTKRDPLNEHKDIPGPGTYKIPSSLKIDEALPPEKQTFSSYGPRFRDAVPQSLKFNIAPGQYDVVVSDFDNSKLKILKQKQNISRSDWAQNIAFASTESRFFSVDKSVAPGPGQYTPKVTLADQLPKQNVRAGAFGTSGKRFKDLKEDVKSPDRDGDDNFGNQGRYPSNVPRRIQRSKFTSAFAPKGKRFLDKDIIGPAPTAYDTRPRWGKTSGAIRMIPPLVESKRSYEDDMPGPGYYDVPSMIESSTKSFNRKNVMISTASRSEKFENNIPGVGSYDLRSSLVRPTHNILLSGEY